MKKKLIATLLSLGLAALMITGCGSGDTGNTKKSAGKPAGKQVTQTVLKKKDGHYVYNVDNIKEASYKINTSAKSATLKTPGYGEAIQYFADEVTKRSKGKIKMQVYTDAQLGGSADEMIGGVTTGAFEFITLNQGSWGDYTDGFMPFNMPFLFANKEQAYKFMDNGMAEKIRNRIIEQTGVRVLCFYDMGFRELTNNRGPIKKAADLKGLKMRTQSDPYQIATFEALGTAVTPVSYAELYSALQQGLVDAQENPLSNIVLQKYYEVQKYLTLTGHNYTLTTMACSEDMWNSWNDDTKALMMDVAEDAMKLCRKGLDKSVAQDLATLKGKMEVYTPTEAERKTFVDAAAPVYDKIKAAIGEEKYNEIMKAAEAAKK